MSVDKFYEGKEPCPERLQVEKNCQPLCDAYLTDYKGCVKRWNALPEVFPSFHVSSLLFFFSSFFVG